MTLLVCPDMHDLNDQVTAFRYRLGNNVCSYYFMMSGCHVCHDDICNKNNNLLCEIQRASSTSTYMDYDLP